MPGRRSQTQPSRPGPAASAAPPRGSASATAEAPGGLRRDLNLFGAVSMIVGIVIGSGIFLGVGRVAAGAGEPWLIVAAFLLGGILTLMGALTYAELGVMFPRAGGPYVFLRESLGPLPAFLSGWTTFTVNLAGSAAALAVVFASQLNSLKPDTFGALVLVDTMVGEYRLLVDGQKLTAAALILVLSVVNWFGLRVGGNVQKGVTILKGSLMVILAAAAFTWAGEAASPIPGVFESTPYVTQHEVPLGPVVAHQGFDPALFFGLAMVAVLFAYDGWTNVTTVGSEIKDPRRNLPRAMLIGIGAVILLYILLSLGYLNVLGMQGFADGKFAGFGSAVPVAANASGLIFGDIGLRLVAVMILVSVLGSLNGITIAGPRYYYAMSRDGLFPRFFGKVNRHHVPGESIWAQAVISIAFLMFLDFNALTDNVVFISLVFYSLSAIALIVLRKRRPDLPRPYKVPLYPWVPLLYITASLLFTAYLTYQAFTNFANAYRIAGLLIVAAGIPLYFVFKAKYGGWKADADAT